MKDLKSLKKILILTGAGFCKPFGLPTTAEFKSAIDNNTGTNLKSSLKNYLGDKYYDIETLLSTLEFYINNKSYIKYLVFNHTRDVHKKPYYDHVVSDLNQLKGEAANLIHELKASLFEILTNYDSRNVINQYSKLLTELKAVYPNSAISFFTTNYDLTFEDNRDSLDNIFTEFDIKDIDFGFTLKNNRNVWDSNKQYNWNPNIVEYKKLHGSLDWNYDKNNNLIQTFLSQRPPNPDKMLLLYPGFKGNPNSQPYKKLHDDLWQRLLTADVVLIMGFAFRDSYINSVFDTVIKIKNDLQLYCFNPLAISALPEESAINYFVENYSKQFFYLEKAITPETDLQSLFHSQDIIDHFIKNG